MIFEIHNSQKIPRTVAVRGIARQVGTTSITANLAAALAARGEKILLLDFCLWNADLTRAFGHSPAVALIDLAQELAKGDTLSMDSIDRYIQSCRPNLDLLPATPQWLESSILRGENGWNFIHALFVCAMDRWNTILVDLGSHVPGDKALDSTFLAMSAIHASILQASSLVIGVCDSIAYLKLWQAQPNFDSPFRDKTIYVVNHHRSDLPFGLDRYKVHASMRAQSHLVPSVRGGLFADEHGLFFMDRARQAEDLSLGERKTMREFQDLAARVSHPILHREESDRSTESFSNSRH